MSVWIPFLTALIWPAAIFILLAVYRREASTVLNLVRRRLERGDKLSVGGFTIESPNPSLGVQSVLSSEATSSRADFILAVTKADTHRRVLIATGAPFSGDPSGVVGAGDALGMAALQAAFLAASSVKVETAIVRPSYAHLAELIRDNPAFLSVGGPYGNKLTRSVMDQTYTTFAFEGSTVHDRFEDEHYAPTIDVNTLSGKDWGMILSLPHPQYGSQGRAVIVAGIQGFGSQGAAMVFAGIQEYEELRAIAEDGCFEGLVEVVVESGKIAKLSVARCRRFDAGSAKGMA